MPRSTVETPQQLDWTSCSDQLAAPAAIRRRSKRASLKEQISARRCCKCCAVIVRHAGLPCMLMTLLGESHVDSALSQTCLSALADSFLFRERLHPCITTPHTHFLPPRDLWGKNSRQRIRVASDNRAHVGSMPACLAVTAERERAFAHPLHLTWSASLHGCEQHDLVRCKWRRNGWKESLLCPVRALRVYIERSASYGRSEQLFGGFGNCAKSVPLRSKEFLGG